MFKALWENLKHSYGISPFTGKLNRNFGDKNIGDRLLHSCHQHQFIQLFILEQIPMKIKFCCSVNHVELGDFAMVGYQFGAPMYKSERPYEGKEFQTKLFVFKF